MGTRYGGDGATHRTTMTCEVIFLFNKQLPSWYIQTYH